jgi:hypothetical protein
MNQPPRTFDQLRALLPSLVQVRDVWWLPQHVVQFPGGHDRYCLIVAVEPGMGDAGSARAHYIAGTTRAGRGLSTVKVAAGTCGPGRDTYFKFFWSSSVDLATLTGQGVWKGRLGAETTAEIDKAIRASRLVALKGVLGVRTRRPWPTRRRSTPRTRRKSSG